MNARYPFSTLVPDLLRALFGVTVCGAVALHVGLDAWLFWIVGVIGIAFAVFGISTALRSTMRIEVLADEVVFHPGPKTVRLSNLSQLRLEYFSTRRDAERGWMQLTFGDQSGQYIRVDSRLEHFEELVELAARAANKNGLDMAASTVENLSAMRGARAGHDPRGSAL